MIHQPEDTVVEDVARRDTVIQYQKLEELTVCDETRMQNLAKKGIIPCYTECD
jgi:hypothetical protein